MSTDEYVPSEDDVRETWVAHESNCAWGPYHGDPTAEFDAFLARVRRDAARAALDQLDAMEARVRDLTQEVRDERGAARDQMEQVRIRDARIKAVEDVLDNPIRLTGWDDPLVSATLIRRALDGG